MAEAAQLDGAFVEFAVAKLNAVMPSLGAEIIDGSTTLHQTELTHQTKPQGIVSVIGPLTFDEATEYGFVVITNDGGRHMHVAAYANSGAKLLASETVEA